jgi:hypothetical protein
VGAECLTLLLPVKHPGNNESVERMPMLAQMPADGDAGAEEIIQLARGGVTDDLLGCLVTRDFAALSWYSARQATMALREGSHERLRCALLAEAIFFAAGREPDDRMLMVSMAVHYYVAEQIGLVPADLFDEIASYLPAGPWPDLIRWFGTRDDVILEAFAWQLVETPDGPDFVSTL